MLNARHVRGIYEGMQVKYYERGREGNENNTKIGFVKQVDNDILYVCENEMLPAYDVVPLRNVLCAYPGNLDVLVKGPGIPVEVDSLVKYKTGNENESDIGWVVDIKKEVSYMVSDLNNPRTDPYLVKAEQLVGIMFFNGKEYELNKKFDRRNVRVGSLVAHKPIFSGDEYYTGEVQTIIKEKFFYLNNAPDHVKYEDIIEVIRHA